MDDLKSLVKLVSKQKIKNLDQLIWTNQNTKFTQLYDLINNDLVKTDEEACLSLYGVQKSQAYYKLKQRMQDRLLNTVFFIDKKSHGLSSTRTKFITLFKNYSLFKILHRRGAKEAAVSLALKSIKLAIELEITDICFVITQYLSRYYAYINFDKKKYAYYRELTSHYREELYVESKIEEYYNLVSHIAVSNTKNFDGDLDIEKMLSEIKKWQNTYDSGKIQREGFQIRTYIHLYKMEFEKCIAVCNEAKEYFSSKSFNLQFSYLVFNNDKFEALLSLGRLNEAKEVLQENLSLVPNESFNWFKIKRMALSLALFERDYNTAYLICKEVVENPNFNKFKTKNELWKIRVAYIQILIQAGYIDLELVSENPMPKYNWNAVLKTLPLYSKDKRGLNITIIVAQLIFMIVNNKSLDILDRIDALNRYCSRYLKNNEELRSNCFLKMIAKLPEADFHPIRVERYVSKYKKRLQSTERILSQEISSTEIIDYEVLWDIILDYIGKNRR